MSSLELTEWMAFTGLEARESRLVHEQKIDPETAYRMVWESDGTDEEEGG